MLRAFDLISKLRARSKYQLLADIHSHKASTKFVKIAPKPGMSEIFFFSNNFWLCAAVVSHPQSLSTLLQRYAIKH